MEQRRIISVIFLVSVIAIALLLFAEYNKVPAPAVTEPRTGEVTPTVDPPFLSSAAQLAS